MRQLTMPAMGWTVHEYGGVVRLVEMPRAITLGWRMADFNGRQLLDNDLQIGFTCNARVEDGWVVADIAGHGWPPGAKTLPLVLCAAIDPLLPAMRTYLGHLTDKQLGDLGLTRKIVGEERERMKALYLASLDLMASMRYEQPMDLDKLAQHLFQLAGMLNSPMINEMKELTDEQLAELGLMRIPTMPAVQWKSSVDMEELKKAIAGYMAGNKPFLTADKQGKLRLEDGKAGDFGGDLPGGESSPFGNCPDCGAVMHVSGCSQRCGEQKAAELESPAEIPNDRLDTPPKPDLPRGGWF